MDFIIDHSKTIGKLTVYQYAKFVNYISDRIMNMEKKTFVKGVSPIQIQRITVEDDGNDHQIVLVRYLFIYQEGKERVKEHRTYRLHHNIKIYDGTSIGFICSSGSSNVHSISRRENK